MGTDEYGSFVTIVLSLLTLGGRVAMRVPWQGRDELVPFERLGNYIVKSW